MNRIEFRKIKKKAKGVNSTSLRYQGFTNQQLKQLHEIGYTKFVRGEFNTVYLLREDKRNAD